jgi:hypothetical protein
VRLKPSLWAYRAFKTRWNAAATVVESTAHAKRAGAGIAPELYLSSRSTFGPMVRIVAAVKKLAATPSPTSAAMGFIAAKPTAGAEKNFCTGNIFLYGSLVMRMNG